GFFFLIFSLTVFFGVKSATAAAIIIMSALATCCWTLLYISSAVCTSILWMEEDGLIADGPITKVTSAPSWAAFSASAVPIFPVEKLLMNLTGSIFSIGGPAVISTFFFVSDLEVLKC